MTRAKISQLDAAAANNTDINAVNVAEGCPPSGINNAIREMGAMLKRMDNGTDHLTDPNITGSLDVDNININGNTISSTDTNGNITVDPNGTGQINLSANVDVTGTVTADGLNVEIPDNNSGPVTIQQGGNSYFKIVTTNTSESVQLGNSTTNPDVLLGSGNVGISNTAPDFNLSVGDSSSVNPSIQIMSATNSNAQLLFGDGAGAAGYRGTVVYGNATDSMSFSTSGSERMRLTSAGLLGLGTSVPSQKAHIYGGSLLIDNGSSAGTIYLHDTTNYINLSGNELQFANNGSERMRLTSAGSLGLGTAAPDSNHKLEVASGGTAEAGIRSGNTSEAILNFGRTNDRLRGRIAYNNSSEYMAFWTNQGEKARLDQSGNMLLGGTNTFPAGNNVVGTAIRPGGDISITKAGDFAIFANRKDSDGGIIDFRKDGTTVGSIGNVGTYLTIGSDDTGLAFAQNLNSIIPHNTSTNAYRDAAVDLGYSTVRFDDIYATNGTIQTSDQQEKNTITDSDLGLDFINRLSPKSYIFNGKTRTHYGLIAQEVETVLGDISKPTSGFAGFIKSDISEEEDGSEYRYGLRYTEFVGPLIQAIKDLKTENDAMRARLDALEAN